MSDKTYIIESFGGRPAWMKMQDIADMYGFSTRTVRDRKNEMLNEIGSRYKRNAVIEDGNIVLINVYCFLDWLQNRKDLMDRNRKKLVKPFNISDWVEYSGAFSRPVKEADNQIQMQRGVSSY